MAVTNIIRSKDVYNVIRKALEIMDVKIMQHGEVTAYLLYKMLQVDGAYGEQELADYTMIGMMHDIGQGEECDLIRRSLLVRNLIDILLSVYPFSHFNISSTLPYPLLKGVSQGYS